MLTGQPIPGTHIFEITYAGELGAAQFEEVRDRFAAFLDAHDPADLLAVYSDLELSEIEPKAVWEDLRSAGLEKKVRRAALLTDAGWLSTLATGASHFIKADVKVFGLGERDSAMAWLES